MDVCLSLNPKAVGDGFGNTAPDLSNKNETSAAHQGAPGLSPTKASIESITGLEFGVTSWVPTYWAARRTMGGLLFSDGEAIALRTKQNDNSNTNKM